MKLSVLRRGRRFWLSMAGWLAAGSLGLAAGSARAVDLASDAAIKADYLYKFLAYVEWPASAFASPEAPHVVAVLSAEPVLAELELLAGRPPAAGQRRVVVRRAAPDESFAGVHLLHIGRGARPAEPALLRAQPVLVVTDAPTGLVDYAALNFVTVDRRVRFEAAPWAAERVGLKLSARLLAVAARVSAP